LTGAPLTWHAILIHHVLHQALAEQHVGGTSVHLSLHAPVEQPPLMLAAAT
jgi:hypothetical protein